MSSECLCPECLLKFTKAFIINKLPLIFDRVSLTLACPMNLKLYPLDRQKCSLRVASCKETFTHQGT